jgi:hypothetical protein
MATPREQRPTSEALTENPAGASTDMITVPTDICRVQLSRIEVLLDGILRSLAPLASAR